ncbi:uncharacterized protein C2orf42 homolog [Lucilia cuprina]|uniref:uncharacterized protein C2orf42 homolog n=1 Tax=Lucilia cuprina TaxID=7375 RepID=UPI001F0514C6|nr:uncharacterized protein C2orf42 homolog [Lucilia cuprina]
MLKSESKCETLTKNNILCRASLRGLKKCTSCGFINGQRALICRNVNCDLRIKRLAAIKPFDPIQLITYGRTKLYSLRSKEKLLNPRNFVSITETVESVESPPSAVCYVDNCKYDAFEPTHLVCRHIKACKVLTDVAVAEVYPIDKSILWNLNIPLEQKQHLWDLYQLEEKLIHPIQKLNSSIFVVKCVESKMFPAGRLHVTVFSNMVPNKSGNFSCSCKKLKLILEPDNSVTMKQEICDHLLLLLAAILNKPEGKTLYGKFLDLLQYLWMPTNLNATIVDCNGANRQSQFMDYDLGLDKCKESTKVENDSSDDLFNFTEELFAENNIPDFSDIILDVNNEKSNNVQLYKKSPQQIKTLEEMHIKDPKLNATTASINDEDLGLNFSHIKTPESPELCSNALETQTNMDFHEAGLSVIEQFQLNHNMQISNDNIELAKDIENLNNLESQVMESSANLIPKQTSLLKSPIANSNLNNNNSEDHSTKPCIVINATNCNTTVPVQKSIVLKQGPVKIIKIATPIQKLSMDKNFNKIIQISKINSNKIIVLKSNQTAAANNKELLMPTVKVASAEDSTLPVLTYESWLDHTIELINDSISIQDSTTVKSTFHVHENIFNHFSKSFTLNNKRRLPNTTSVVKSGKYKDLIKYTWYLNQASTVQRIFSTKNLKIELERSYQRLNDGSFELYTPANIQLTENNNFRPIYPKLQLYKAFIQFTNNAELSTNNLQSQKCGLKLEWLPSAFPKSNFGLMTIEFCVSVKEPDVIL